MKCKICGNELRFNGEFTYHKENKKFKGKDWYYCSNCDTNIIGAYAL